MSEPVNRRASLPGASELFRTTRSQPDESPQEKPSSSGTSQAPSPGGNDRAGTPAATGRVRHDKKITVYFSSDELFALEDATLDLKRHHGLSLDRGRLVRTAVALALADLAEHGGDSAVVRELRSQ